LTPLFRRSTRFVAVLLVALFSGVPNHLFAQEHVVSPGAIQQQLLDSARQHDRDLATLNQFFGSESAQTSLKSAGLSSKEVKLAVAQLSDEELAKLAAKAGSAQQNFAAGSLTNQQLTYIIIALATAVIILVIIEA
jgi:hypothetical protein